MKGGRVSHSWCMSVVSHGYGGLGGVRIEVVDGMHAGEDVACWEMPEHFQTARCRHW